MRLGLRYPYSLFHVQLANTINIHFLSSSQYDSIMGLKPVFLLNADFMAKPLAGLQPSNHEAQGMEVPLRRAVMPRLD